MELTMAKIDQIRIIARECLHSNNLSKAYECYRDIIKTKKKEEHNLEDIINYGYLMRKFGGSNETLEYYRACLQCFCDNEILVLNACNFLRSIGLASEAYGYLSNLLINSSASDDLRLTAVECLIDLGDMEIAGRLIETVSTETSAQKRATIARGILEAKRNNLQEAYEYFVKALALDPLDLTVRSNTIAILTDLGKTSEAQKILESTEDIDRNSAMMMGALSGILVKDGKYVEATHVLKKLCEMNPLDHTKWLNWASSLRGLKYTLSPLRVLKWALVYHPTNYDLQEALAQGYAEISQWESAIRIYSLQDSKRLSDIKEINIFNRLFLSLYGHLMRSSQCAEMSREWEQNKIEEGLSNLYSDYLREPLTGRKVKVGYLTADACNHPVARFLLPIVKHHDRDKYEITMIHCGRVNDGVTEQLRANVDRWVDCSSLSDKQAARVIADLRLDVIIELGGFTGGSRLGIMTYRPAAIQLSYLGYPGPTFLKCIDGWIGDETLFAQLNSEEDNAHKKLLVDGGYMSFCAEHDLQMRERNVDDRVIFGCFNHARKLGPETINLFCEVLRANKGAALALKSISFHEAGERSRVLHLFKNKGIKSERIKIFEWVQGYREHMDLYSSIDIALDPTPYGGATTTCEALWMGVPVITHGGFGMVSRLSASILVAAGCREWIAKSEADYVKISTELSTEGPRKIGQRLELRNKIAASKLCDAVRLSKNLEDIYNKLIEQSDYV